MFARQRSPLCGETGVDHEVEYGIIVQETSGLYPLIRHAANPLWLARDLLGELRGGHVRADPVRASWTDRGHRWPYAGIATSAVGSAVGGREPGNDA